MLLFRVVRGFEVCGEDGVHKGTRLLQFGFSEQIGERERGDLGKGSFAGLVRGGRIAKDLVVGAKLPIARRHRVRASLLSEQGRFAMVERSGQAFDPLTLPESNKTGYPEPYRADNQRRWNRRLGNHAGLQNFGVNITRIEPGGQSAARHWHLRQDEFVYVLAGEVVLHMDAGEEVLGPGMCVGFAAGVRDGHRFLNRTETDALLLVVGDRTLGDEVGYPDIDMHLAAGPDGKVQFTRKDGTPFG